MASRQLAHFKIRLRYHDIIEMLKNNDCCGFWFLVLRIVPNIQSNQPGIDSRKEIMVGYARYCMVMHTICILYA
mgnify:FL=1